jgi:hypothetical protein
VHHSERGLLVDATHQNEAPPSSLGMLDDRAVVARNPLWRACEPLSQQRTLVACAESRLCRIVESVQGL